MRTKDDILSYEFYLQDFLTFQAKKEYMGLAIKNDNLVYVYNLGTKDVEHFRNLLQMNCWLS